MRIPTWWNAIDRESRHWIAEHLGEVLPVDVADSVDAAGGRLRETRFLDADRAAFRLQQRDVRGILASMTGR
ncbi:MAG TPA: hypothetical protein VIG76_05990 [Amnibacterium sp.]|jgi:hypothetical protein|uniref:hypothetical protein n=1 Tax=Amnibacterium sp. TaxID=1872496 RepID=UPI002F91D33C